ELEISFGQNVEMPLPKWILCGTHGTLTNDGQKSVVRWFDPQDAPPLEGIDGPARDRKYGNHERPPGQGRGTALAQRPHGAFYDHVNAVLAGREAMRVTPAS